MLNQCVHLEGVFHDLRDRYGNDDPIVVQLKLELEARLAIESRYPARVIARPKRHWGIASGRHLDGVPGRAS